MAIIKNEEFELVMITEAKEIGFENIWQISLVIIIVGLSIIMPIFYSYQRNKKSK
jgi:hypothetical protein